MEWNDSIILILIIFFAIGICIILLQIQNQDIQEGLSLKSLGRKFNSLGRNIKKTAKGLSKLTKIVNSIVKQFACLFKILANYKTCLWSFFLDLCFNLILFNIFLLFYVFFIYLPLWIGQTTIHAILPAYFNKPAHNTPFDYFIRKKLHDDTIKNFSMFFETIYTAIFRKSAFLYRNKKTIGNCYCYPFLKWMFLPLTTNPNQFFAFEIPLKQTALTNSIAYFIFACCVIFSFFHFSGNYFTNENQLALEIQRIDVAE